MRHPLELRIEMGTALSRLCGINPKSCAAEYRAGMRDDRVVAQAPARLLQIIAATVRA